MATTEAITRRARADARALSGRVGYVERDGIRVFYEVYGSGRADGLAPADLGAHSLAALEDADSVPRAPLPRRDVRSVAGTGVRTGRRTPRPTTSASSRPTHSPCWTRRTRSGGARVALTGCTARTRSGRRASRARFGRSSSSRRQCRWAIRPGKVAVYHPFEEAARHGRGLGEVQRALLAARLPRVRRVLHVAGLHGAALDEADRGRGRVGARDRRRDSRRHSPRAGARQGGGRASSVAACSVPCWSSR